MSTKDVPRNLLEMAIQMILGNKNLESIPTLVKLLDDLYKE